MVNGLNPGVLVCRDLPGNRYCGGSRGGLGGSVEPPFGSLISMKNTDLNVYFCSKVPFREFTNPPSQNPGSAPEICYNIYARYAMKFVGPGDSQSRMEEGEEWQMESFMRIGDSKLPFASFKASPSAKPFIGKLALLTCE